MGKDGALGAQACGSVLRSLARVWPAPTLVLLGCGEVAGRRRDGHWQNASLCVSSGYRGGRPQRAGWPAPRHVRSGGRSASRPGSWGPALQGGAQDTQGFGNTSGTGRLMEHPGDSHYAVTCRPRGAGLAQAPGLQGAKPGPVRVHLSRRLLTATIPQRSRALNPGWVCSEGSRGLGRGIGRVLVCTTCVPSGIGATSKFSRGRLLCRVQCVASLACQRDGEPHFVPEARPTGAKSHRGFC